MSTGFLLDSCVETVLMDMPFKVGHAIHDRKGEGSRKRILLLKIAMIFFSSKQNVVIYRILRHWIFVMTTQACRAERGRVT